MSHQDSSKDKSEGHGLLIGLLMGLIIAGGFFAWWIPQMRAMQGAWSSMMATAPPFAMNWYADLRAGRIFMAYGNLSNGLKARLDRTQFDRLIADHPELKLPSLGATWAISGGKVSFNFGIAGAKGIVQAPTLTYTATLQPSEDSRDQVRFIVIQDNGRLAVDYLTVEPVPPKP